MGDVKISRLLGFLCAVVLALGASVAFHPGKGVTQPAAPARTGLHEGVASCAGSTCHGRPVASGVVVRQNELITWQDPSSAAGAHSRAWRSLTTARGQAIANRMGLGPAQSARACLGCHADVRGARGPRHQLSDGVGCEACHGGSGGWIASHYTVGATHSDNVARGMRALDDPKARAAVCLDCHFGGPDSDQFVTHEMMAAGHPRIAFELDLFTAMQKHHDVDADYLKRKSSAGAVKTWAVGQAMAVERAAGLFAARGGNGNFPEFYFFDCHSCHRAISDDPRERPRAEANPGRPIAAGQPPFNDENMIMLSAAARVVAPGVAGRLDAESRAFHAALTGDRAGARAAAQRLAATSRALADSFAARSFRRAETLAILQAVAAGDRRYTDYAGGSQAVMAADTLLNALASEGPDERAAAGRMRPVLDRAYAAVRDPNSFRPAEFRQAMQQVAAAAKGLQ